MSEGSTATSAATDETQTVLDNSSIADRIIKKNGRNVHLRSLAVPEIWVARMLRAGGAVIVVSTVVSVITDLSMRGPSRVYSVGSDGIALVIGVVAFAFAGWLSLRRWRPLLLVGYGLMLLNYAMCAIVLGDLVSLLYPTILLTVGIGALTPWESRWQLAYNALTLLVWALVCHHLAPSGPRLADAWVTVLTAVGLGQCSVFIRQQFAVDNLKARQELNESQARLRKILGVSPDTVSIIRAKDLLVCEVFGSRPNAVNIRENMVGKRLTDGELYTDRQKLPDILGTLAQQHEFHDVEMDYRTDDGRLVHSLMSATQVQMDGESYFVSFARDITELKRAQGLLAESERRFRTVFKAMPGAAGIMSPQGEFLDLSKPLSGSGFTREEVIGKTADEIGFWAEPAEREEFNRRLRGDGFIDGMEVHMGRKEGGSIPVLVSLAPLEIEGERCAVSIVHDITELKNAQKRAVESQAALGRIFEASTDGMTLTDFHTGEIIEVNAEFTRLTGYTREEAIGRDVGSLNLWTDRVKASEFVKLLRSTKEARNIQDFVHTKLGDLVPCLMSGAVVDYAGRRCCLAVSRDITVLKRTQDQLVAAREAALAASQAKSEFLSSMSHEIRTPLNAILGMAELLDESRLDPDQRKYLDTMRHNGDALLRLINDILDLAKVESGRLTLESTEFDMEDLVGGVVEMLAVRAHSKGLELLSRVKPEVMPRVCGDPLRLRQILINLLGNSIKFTNSGQVLVTVERDEGSTDSALHFSVSDTGIGIAEDKLATIFSNFTQADSSTTRRYGGSGLGLAIAKRLVELMGGRIWVESEKDRGSVFHFTAQFEKTQTDETEKKAIALPPQLRDSRVLIVDDNETNRLILKEMMTTAGARPVEAESGARALSLVEEAWRLGSRYGLVLLDRRMPQMDGLEVARRLRKFYHDITIIMLTSDDLRLNKSTLDEYALDGYLTKPVRRQELFEAVALAQARRSGRGLTISTARPRSVDNAEQQLDAAGLRILLADDSADNRLLVHAYCKNFPISFDDAEDGRIAVDKWKREKYDLIIMDVQMPEMDGLTAIRIIRNCEKKTGNLRTPVIALSAGALEEDVRRSLAAGADLHVSKPVKKKTLMDAILKLTESTNLVQSNAG